MTLNNFRRAAEIFYDHAVQVAPSECPIRSVTLRLDGRNGCSHLYLACEMLRACAELSPGLVTGGGIRGKFTRGRRAAILHSQSGDKSIAAE